MSQIAVLGATGSIGASALDVIGRHPGRFTASILSAQTRVDALVELCRRFRPLHAVIEQSAHYQELRDGLLRAGLDTEPHAGAEALAELSASAHCDTVIAAIVGAAGMNSTLSAARAGKRLLLANKESVVLAGDLLMRTCALNGAQIIPIDSEHNAIFQCLHGLGANQEQVRKLILTASGGPFLNRSRAELVQVTAEQACDHPNWKMGRKISVDSATLMNKGLEVIEAHWLFGMPPGRIDVLVHPQSIVHSMVEHVDGSVLAQLGQPDMRSTLACALAWPERVGSGVAALDWSRMGPLTFQQPDHATFGCLDLAYAALKAGGTASATLNAANEIAVEAFLDGRIGFLDIPAVIEATLEASETVPADSIQTLLAADAAARRDATARVQQRARRVGAGA
jgi:1-deoxy-D-xylulose-5-phosphate reductoisomerase